MDLLAKRNELMQSLNQVNSNMAALEKQFAEMQVSRERIIGAILVIDELLGSEKAEQLDGGPVDGGITPCYNPPG